MRSSIKKFIYILEPLVISALLFLFCLIFASYFSSEPVFFVLDSPKTPTDSIELHTKELYTHKIVHGTFTAQEDYLGIVSVRFHTFKRINKDHVIFRLKAKGSNNWYYQNIYKVDQFQPDKLFTFGFPLIKNAKNKQYIFEIESMQGKKKDAVAISPIEPIFVTKYQYPKSEFLTNKKAFILYPLKKLLNLFNDSKFILYASFYFLPLLTYIFLKISFKKYLYTSYFASIPFVIFLILQTYNLSEKKNFLIITAVFIILIYNILPLIVNRISTTNKKIAQLLLPITFALFILINNYFTTDVNIISELLLFIFWLIIIRVAKLRSKSQIVLSLVFLTLSALFAAFNNQLLAERGAILTYYLLIFYVIHASVELRHRI